MTAYGPWAAFMSSVTWAVGSAVYSRYSRTRSPFSVNFTRAAIALPIFLVVAFVTAGSWSEGVAAFRAVEAWSFGWLALSMVASYAVGDLCFLVSTRTLGVPGALAIASVYPMWTAFVQPVPLTPLQWVGLALTLAGASVVILNAPRAVSDGSATGRRGVGVLLALLTSFFWALNGYAVSRGGQGLDPSVSNCIRMLWALFLTFFLSRIWGRPGESLLIPRHVLGKDAWIFAVEAFAGSSFYVYGLAHSSLVVGSTLSSLAPVLAVPVAWFLRLEKVSPLRTLGVVLVVAGLALLV